MDAEVAAAREAAESAADEVRALFLDFFVWGMGGRRGSGLRDLRMGV